MKKRGKFLLFLERTRFPGIFAFWFIMIFGFGLLYYFTNTTVHILTYTVEKTLPVGLGDSIYFSFVTAATIGYGDITPVGIGKFLAVLEGMLGMLTYGLVISKLVSVKQETILDEVYTLSFEEHLNRLRSTLYLSRSDLSKFIAKIENKDITKQELKDLPSVIHGLDSTLNDVLRIISNTKERAANHYLKNIENIHLNIIFNSLNVTAEKVLELLYSMRDAGLSWKNEKMTQELRSVKDSLKLLAEPYMNHKEEQIKKKANNIYGAGKDIEGFFTDIIST
ncbi:MAG: potassium channel family protein [Nanoarchaeota archaeon]|nr:potassium channel family protein [Nanoarchaeota archaeon]